MQKKNTRKPRQSSTRKDPLEAYRQQAAVFIRLYFSASTPPFVRDVISSWLTGLENETQIFWNRREVLEVALPIMLQQADRDGVDVLNVDGQLCAQALGESVSVARSHELLNRVYSDDDILHAEIGRDAEAFARLINSRHLSQDIRSHIASVYDELTDIAMNNPDVIKAKYTAAMLEHAEGSAENEK